MKFDCLYLIIGVISVAVFSETINDAELLYSVEIPQTWEKQTISETHHQLYDSTGSYSSVISIRRYDLSADTSFDNPKEWARASYLAYIINVQSTMTEEGIALSDPFGITVYYDSTDVKQNDSLWAGEVYAKYYSTDTSLSSWAEYIRFTADDRYGYEIYAIGLTEDMDTAVGYYAAIIDGFKLTSSESAVIYQTVNRNKNFSADREKTFSADLLGRKMSENRRKLKATAPGIYIIKKKHVKLYNLE